MPRMSSMNTKTVGNMADQIIGTMKPMGGMGRPKPKRRGFRRKAAQKSNMKPRIGGGY
jgi:hypothetical protein